MQSAELTQKRDLARNEMNIAVSRPSLAAILAAALLAHATAAGAHPHVWVTAEATVVYEKGAIVGLNQRWVFDELYTTMAVDGLDANKDGVFDRTELAELASVNMEGLKEFNYFTSASTGKGRAAEFDTPKDYWLDYGPAKSVPGPGGAGATAGSSPAAPAQEPSGGAQPGLMQQLGRALFGTQETAPPADAKPKVLALNFMLPFKNPVAVESEPLTFSVSDPSFFIWFDFDKDNPVRMAEGAPNTCKVTIGAPAADAAETQRLNDAFMTQLGGPAGSSSSKTLAVQCPK